MIDLYWKTGAIAIALLGKLTDDRTDWHVIDALLGCVCATEIDHGPRGGITLNDERVGVRFHHVDGKQAELKVARNVQRLHLRHPRHVALDLEAVGVPVGWVIGDDGDGITESNDSGDALDLASLIHLIGIVSPLRVPTGARGVVRRIRRPP